jgi:hypothetical protein
MEAERPTYQPTGGWRTNPLSNLISQEDLR